MKKLFSAIVLLLSFTAISQSTIVTYQESSDVISNPERGFYYHTSTHSTSYQLLNESSLITKRQQENLTLILRVFYLENFRNADISTSYLTNMQTDFNRCRNAGFKMIVRFAYSDGSTSGNYDTDKARILSHLQQLQPVIAANQDVIACFQAGFVGKYGEGWNSSFYGDAGVISASQQTDRNQIIQAILTTFALPYGKTVQLRTPKFKQNFTGTTVANTTPYNPTYYSCFLGHHNDAFLSSSGEQGTYAPSSEVTAQRLYVETEGKYTVVGGEANTYPTSYTSCDNAVAMMDKYSYSYFNSVGYASGLVDNWTANGCYNEMKKRLGYRFVALQSEISPTSLSIKLKNSGFGHLFNQRSVYLVYRHVTTHAETQFLLETDARLWLKGSDILLTQQIPILPADGAYDVFLYMPDNSTPNPNYAIQLANNGMWESVKGYNNLQIRLYPVALGINAIVYNNHININSNIYKVKIFDMTGKQVSEDTDLSSLPKGVYIIKITTPDNVYTLKVTR